MLGLKRIYKIKHNENGTTQKHKARLVVEGYSQQPKVDFQKPFAPIACMETIRIVLSLAAQLELQVFQFDVKMTFLNGELRKEVHVESKYGST